ncbi:MAG: polysaccharide deacetylase family protein [Acidimicrobiia bacterium]
MSVLRSAAKTFFAATDLLFPSPRGPRILIYHQVGAGLGRQMEVTTEAFSWQLEWLAQNREVVSLDTAIERWHEPDADRLAVLTFDDGYRDTYTTAFPLMAERRVPFTLYLSTEMIESGSNEGGAEPLQWQQIEAMVDSGLVTVGSHTHTHRDLRLASEDETLWEVESADSIIEERLGVRTRHFAYPWGYWGESAHKVVRQRYESAVLGAPTSRSSFDPHRIHRYPIQLSDGTAWFGARLGGGLVLEERLRRRLRGYDGP